MSTEKRYTLPEAQQELVHRQCRAEGHDLTLLEVRQFNGDHTPAGVHCERCGRHWDTVNGRGGINLGEATP